MTYQKKFTPMEVLYIMIAMLVGMVFLLSMVGDDIKITYHVPDQAIVYADLDSKLYYAPPYIDNNRYPSDLDVSRLKAMKVSETQALNLTPERACVDKGYFQEQDTLNHVILWKLGWADPKPSRWNPDGSWNF